MHTVFALLCFVVVIHWLIFPYPSGLLHWHCGNLTIAPVPAKQPWWIWINTSCEFIMNDCITTTKQSTKKTCAYFLGYTVCEHHMMMSWHGFTFWITGPLWEESTSNQWIPLTNGQQCRALMLAWTSCWANGRFASDLDVLMHKWHHFNKKNNVYCNPCL